MVNKRIKKYHQLVKRIKYMEKEIEIYRFTLENANRTFPLKDLLSRFRYEKTLRYGGVSGAMSSRLGKYLYQPFKEGELFVTVKDQIWITQEFLHFSSGCYRIHAGKFFLVLRESLPFWLLEEFGGYLRSTFFIEKKKERISQWKQEIKDLKLPRHK